MAKDVTFNIKLKIDGKDHVVEASTDIKKLAEELGIAKTKGDELRNTLLKFNQIVLSFQNIVTGMQQLTGVMHQFTDATSEQELAEAKLANNMRNTMNAREEDIQSIKDLCSAQQQLGVIGDEVQLSGAQELATYLEKKSSLEKLIPVMNDMLAQQYGLNATSESAAQIASMLGKVMDGQVGALSRYGYKFDEVQEQILKFGTEEQRAAVLADVVSSSVGGMNAELAKTDAGKAKQAANNFGDWKEKVGEMLTPMSQLMEKTKGISLFISSIGTTWKGLQGVIVFIKTLNVVTYANAVASKVAAVATSFWAKQVKFFNQMQLLWAFGAKKYVIAAGAMRVATLGLMAVTGVGLAIAAVSSIISLFSSKMSDSTNEMKKTESEAEKLQSAIDSENQSYSQARAALEINIAKLKDFKGTKEQERKVVEEMNNTYGETMGYFDSVSKWYDALVQNSETYCRQMVIEAKTRAYANQIAEKELETEKIESNIAEGNYSDKNKTYKQVISSGTTSYGAVMSYTKDVELEGTSELAEAQKQVESNREAVENLTKKMSEAVKEAGELDYKVKGSTTRPIFNNNSGENSTKITQKQDLSLVEHAKTYKDLANNVSYYQQELEKADITDKDNILSLARKKAEAEKLVEEFKKLTDVSEKAAEYKPEDISKLSTVGDIDKAISFYTDEQKKADANKIQELQEKINALTAKKNILQIGTELPDMQKQMDEINSLTGKELTMKITGLGFDELTAKVKELNALLSNTENPLTDEQREQVVRLRDQYAIWANTVQQTTDKMKALEGVSNVAGSVDTLASSLKGLAGESKEMAAAMAGVSLAATIAQMVAGMVKKANETTLTIWDWIAGIAAGTAAVISAASQLKGISAFANGGIVSGPTMALVGEYAGASNNPEVIAPLDKLRSMIKTPDDNGGRVTFHIEGRTLVGVLNKENNMRGRS